MEIQYKVQLLADSARVGVGFATVLDESRGISLDVMVLGRLIFVELRPGDDAQRVKDEIESALNACIRDTVQRLS